MVTSSVGFLVLKEVVFKKTNSIFQLISSVLFALLIILFNFHTGDKLLENYNRVEIFVLIISYILLSILVGCCSTISLKEFFNLINEVFYKDDKMAQSYEKGLFYIFSGLSSFIIIFINRLIFTSFDNKTSKWLLISIVSVCFAFFFLSLIFHILFSIPVVNKKEKKEIEQIQINYQYEIKEDEKKQNQEEFKKNEEENLENKIKDNENKKKVKFNNVKGATETELITVKRKKNSISRTFITDNKNNNEVNAGGLIKSKIKEKNLFIQQKFAPYVVIYMLKNKLEIKKLVYFIIILVNAHG